MHTYKVSAHTVVHSFNAATQQEGAHPGHYTIHIEAASEAAAIEQAEPQLASRAWFEADCAIDDIEDTELLNVTVTIVTERDRLAALPRNIAPVLPGFEASIDSGSYNVNYTNK